MVSDEEKLNDRNFLLLRARADNVSLLLAMRTASLLLEAQDLFADAAEDWVELVHPLQEIILLLELLVASHLHSYLPINQDLVDDGLPGHHVLARHKLHISFAVDCN